jgi:hypothetical protein
MRYAVGKISLVVVVGAVFGAAWVSAQPAQPTAPNTRDSRGMVLMVQWSGRDINKDYYTYHRSSDVPGITAEMLRCYKKCYEQVYDDGGGCLQSDDTRLAPRPVGVPVRSGYINPASSRAASTCICLASCNSMK